MSLMLQNLVHKMEVGGGGFDGLLRGVLRQDKRLERGFVTRGVAIGILEDTVHLHLDPAIFTVPDLRNDFEPSVRRGAFLDAGAGQRILNAGVHQNHPFGVFVRRGLGLLRQVRSLVIRALARGERQRGAGGEKKNGCFHCV